MQKLLRRSTDYFLIILGPLWVAVAMYLLAKGEAWALSWNQVLFQHNPYWLLLVMPLGFALIRYSTMKLAPQAGGSGIPQVMAVIHVGRVRAMLKTFVSPLQALYKMVLVVLGMLWCLHWSRRTCCANRCSHHDRLEHECCAPYSH